MKQTVYTIVVIGFLVGAFCLGFFWKKGNETGEIRIESWSLLDSARLKIQSGINGSVSSEYDGTYIKIDSVTDLQFNKNGWEIVSDDWSKGYRNNGRLVVLSDSLLQRDLIKVLEYFIRTRHEK